MTPELLDELVVNLALLVGFLFILTVGGIIADYIFRTSHSSSGG